jgi:hypothetical protein
MPASALLLLIQQTMTAAVNVNHFIFELLLELNFRDEREELLVLVLDVASVNTHGSSPLTLTMWETLLVFSTTQTRQCCLNCCEYSEAIETSTNLPVVPVLSLSNGPPTLQKCGKKESIEWYRF